MSENSIYQKVLLDHARQPRNRGDLQDADVLMRASNPRCGDDLEIGILFDHDILHKVLFRGRGCSVCIASASLMTQVVTGKNREQASKLYQEMKAWFTVGEGNYVPQPPASLHALSAVREYPARRRCVLLAWEALHDALSDHSLNSQ